ncbi:MAG TPA: FkbM family methyltransferase [Solirubrobacteraceae bacterium]|nr:FkbM family methyltransferase [Solirubrobacteraceae bacterium]
MRLRRRLAVLGINRSLVLRVLIRFGHPKLRELRARAIARRGLSGLALGVLLGRLERGVLRVPQGHAGGLAFDMRYLPVSHAHFGSIAFGNLETAVQEAMVRHLGDGGVFYDIGANLGFFALLGAHLAGLQNGHVYAFEAAPDNAEAIRSNAALNGIANVTVIAKAVAGGSGRGRLQVVDDQSWSKLENYGEHPYTEQVIDVDLVAIDDLIAAGELRPPTVVKIDVEGAELAVLEGMSSTIDAYRPAIICELHDTHAEFVTAMRAHGYRLVNLEGTIPVAQQGASAHALALPPLDEGD